MMMISKSSTWCGCWLLLALLAALLGATASWLFTVQADAPWRNAAAAEWLEAAESPRAPESKSSLPSSYAVLERSTQRIYVRTTIRASDLPQCADGAVDCSTLPVGAGTREWVRREVEDPTPYCMQRVRRAVRSLGVLYHYDVGALMGFPRLHLLDSGGWATLLPDLPTGAVALDVGAGSGHLLRDFRPLFSEVVATELSRALVWRLQQQGAHAFQTETIDREALGGWWDFDTVFLLNVIDRCKDPVALLRQATAALKPGGTLVVAVPLPWEQLDARRSNRNDKQTSLALQGDTWEAAASHLLQLLAEQGLRPRRLVRAPYWCTGSDRKPVQALDGAVVVLDSGVPGT